MNFNPEIEEFLRGLGWSEDRRISISDWEEALIRNEFTLTDHARAILENLGELRFKPPLNEKAAYYPEETWFNPLLPLSRMATQLHIWEERMDINLCPLGQVWNRAALVLGSDNSFYAILDIGVHLLGENINELLGMLIIPHNKPELKHDTSDYR